MNFNRKNAKIPLFAGLLLCSSFILPADYTKITGNPLYKYALLLSGTAALEAGAVFAGMRPKTFVKIGLALAALYGSARLFERYWTAVPAKPKESGPERKRAGAQEEVEEIIQQPISIQLHKKHVLGGHKGLIYDAQFSRDSDLVVTAGQDGVARVWYVVTGIELKSLHHENSVYSASFNQDGQKIVTECADNNGYIWHPFSGKYRVVLDPGRNYGLHNSLFSPDGSLVAALAGEFLFVWDVSKGQIKKKFDNKHFFNVFSFSPNAQYLFAGGEDGVVYKISDFLSDPSKIETLRGHQHGITSLSFGSYGDRFVTGSKDATARIWKVNDREKSTILAGHTDRINSVSFSPDEKRVVTASDDTTARLWDSATGKQLRVLKGHTGFVTNASFNQDGSLILTNSVDGTARLWDSATGIQLQEISCMKARFNPSGTSMVTIEKEVSRKDAQHFTVTIWEIIKPLLKK